MAAEQSPVFQFYPREWLWTCIKNGLTLRERGRIFTDVIEAVMARDREAVKPWQGTFIGRVYWHDPNRRPHIPTDIQRAVFQRDSGQCQECGSDERLEFDHIIAYSRGGPGTLENLRLLCRPCNRRKGAA